MRAKLTVFSPFWPISFSFFLAVILITTFHQRDDPQSLPHNSRIAIVVVLLNGTVRSDYEVAINTVECYARVHKYNFILAADSDYDCPQKNKFFRRHCVVSKILPRFDAVFFIDADYGVVNPKRRIEEFMDPQFDLTFHDRFSDWKVQIGSYIAKNSEYTIQFLKEFAELEDKLPKGAHGSDSGAIHIFLAEKIFGRSVEVETCHEVYFTAKNTYDVAAYIACVRGVLGFRTDFGNIRIMKKGTGWSREDWLTSGLWTPSLDFMLNGWETKQLKEPPPYNFGPRSMSQSQWYNPLAGPIVLERCSPGNTSWSYNLNLITEESKIRSKLAVYGKEVERNKMNSMGRLADILDRL